MRRDSYLQLRQSFDEFIFKFDAKTAEEFASIKELFDEYDHQFNLEGRAHKELSKLKSDLG